MLRGLRQRRAFKKGCDLLESGQWREAESALALAVQLDPEDAGAFHNLGIALLKLERWEEAGAVCRRAIRLNAHTLDAHVNFSTALVKMHRWEEAVTALRFALTRYAASPSALEKLGLALTKLERHEEASEVYRDGIDLAPDQADLQKNLGLTLQRLGRTEEAIAPLRRASILDPDDAEASSHFEAAVEELERIRNEPAGSPVQTTTQEHSPARVAPAQMPHLQAALHLMQTAIAQLEHVQAGEQTAALGPPTDAAAPPPPAEEPSHLQLGMQLMHMERWEEATHALREGITCLEYLRVDPLMKMGQFEEAGAAYARAVEMAGTLPPWPPDAATLFEQRRSSFWREENVGQNAIAIEQWLEGLANVPPRDDSREGRRLLFVLDNDYGELTTLMYFALGRDLVSDITLLLPARLHANNGDAIPSRTHQYASAEDIVDMIDREKPDIVFLCSGYLMTIHELLSLEELEHLVTTLRARGCRVVTTDPFLGTLSMSDPRSIVSIAVPDNDGDEQWEGLTERVKVEEERLRTHLTECERILRAVGHLYPSHCEASDQPVTASDERNLAAFNSHLIYPELEANDASVDDHAKPQWLFILSRTDYDVQMLFEGHSEFVGIVASKLIEAVAAGRHPIFVGPKDFIAMLEQRLPTAEGIDLLHYCPFNQLMALLLNAEFAFYWNVVSHSILFRLFNQLPVVLFDKGHLVRNVDTLYERIVRWYYQGWEPDYLDHARPLTLETVSTYATRYREEAAGIVDRFRRAPTPEQLVDALTNARSGSSG